MLPGYDCFHNSEGYHFDGEAADRALDFLETLEFIEGSVAGQPMVLDEWQQAFVGCVFGWLDNEGLRRYKEVFFYVPRKNGKSPLAAALGLYVFLCDGEPGAQCYIAAADIEQASIVYRHAEAMMQQSPTLNGIVASYKSLRSMQFGNSFFRVISSEAASKHGYNSHLVIVDELHAQPNRDLVDVLTSSTSSREQPLTLYLTTADFERPSICNDKLAYAEQVRDGVLSDPEFLPVLYMADKDDDWTDEAIWYKSNPGLGTIKKLDYMRRAYKKAITERSYQNTFRRLELNQKTGTETVWLSADEWDNCADSFPSDEELKGEPCWGGLDLSTTTDLTAFALCWPSVKCRPGRVLVKVWHWIPRDKAFLKQREDRVPYMQWISDGHVDATPGNVVDYAYIRQMLNDEILPRYDLKDIGSDPWNATQLITELREQDGIPIVAFRQGFVTMSAPCKELERLVMSGVLLHEGSEILKWQAANAVVRSDPAGNLKPDKEKAKQRIDGMVAIIMSIGRATVESATWSASVYEERGLLTM